MLKIEISFKTCCICSLCFWDKEIQFVMRNFKNNPSNFPHPFWFWWFSGRKSQYDDYWKFPSFKLECLLRVRKICISLLRIYHVDSEINDRRFYSSYDLTICCFEWKIIFSPFWDFSFYTIHKLCSEKPQLTGGNTKS